MFSCFHMKPKRHRNSRIENLTVEALPSNKYPHNWAEYTFGLFSTQGTVIKCLFFSKERWPSGRRRSTGNAVCSYGHRGFESLPLRQNPSISNYDLFSGMDDTPACALHADREVVPPCNKQAGDLRLPPAATAFTLVIATTERPQ